MSVIRKLETIFDGELEGKDDSRLGAGLQAEYR